MRSFIEASESSSVLRDCQLVQQAASDPEAFAKLYSLYRDDCLHVAHVILENWSDVEDAVQQGLMKAFIHLALFEMRASFRSWLMQIVINECRMILRQRRRASLVSINEPAGGRAWELPSRERSPEEQFHLREVSATVRDQLQRLPSGFQDPLTLQVYDELGIEAVAERLGLTRETTKTRLRRAREKLRVHLKRSQVVPNGTIPVSQTASK
ncbi:MAG TPA: sigma-70 family RNA polymerase sigma factor [Bryobacteraceae bacterium]|nr:sigma-70 family RNA polymerase sigma factor [Bryobacteraceae bacterium]